MLERDWSEGLTEDEKSYVHAVVTIQFQQWLRGRTFEGTFKNGVEWRFSVDKPPRIDVDITDVVVVG